MVKKLSKIINIRLDEELLANVDEISSWDESERSETIRKLLKKAINLRKLDYAVKLYQEEKASIGKAAEIANISLWELQDHLQHLGIQHKSDKNDLDDDVKILLKLHQKGKKMNE